MATSQVSDSELIESVAFDAQGLVPVIAQDSTSGQVLMLAWMNRQALELTLETRRGTYFSRSRSRIWVKGEESGNVQEVISLSLDCDGDAIVMSVQQHGPACHTGSVTCFSRVRNVGSDPS
ncbi:MAG: phosphoribosyl-AMP cyclohydrolase [Candidatus Nanopelagicales bacterium]